MPTLEYLEQLQRDLHTAFPESRFPGRVNNNNNNISNSNNSNAKTFSPSPARKISITTQSNKRTSSTPAPRPSLSTNSLAISSSSSSSRPQFPVTPSNRDHNNNTDQISSSKPGNIARGKDLLSDILSTITKKRSELKHEFNLTASLVAEEHDARKNHVESCEVDSRKTLIQKFRNIVESVNARCRIMTVNREIPSEIKSQLAERGLIQRQNAADRKKLERELRESERAKEARKMQSQAHRNRERELDKMERALIEQTERIQTRRDQAQGKVARVKSAMESVNRTRARAVAIESAMNRLDVADQTEKRRNQKRQVYAEIRRQVGLFTSGHDVVVNSSIDGCCNNNSNSNNNHHENKGGHRVEVGTRLPILSPSAFLQTLYRVNDEDTMSEAKKRQLFWGPKAATVNTSSLLRPSNQNVGGGGESYQSRHMFSSSASSTTATTTSSTKQFSTNNKKHGLPSVARPRSLGAAKYLSFNDDDDEAEGEYENRRQDLQEGRAVCQQHQYQQPQSNNQNNYRDNYIRSSAKTSSRSSVGGVIVGKAELQHETVDW